MSMKNVVLGMGITGLIFTSSLTVNITPSFSQTPSPDKLTFSCGTTYDAASGKKIPATMVWLPGQKANKIIMIWKSAYFDKTMPPEERCQKVTQNFQTQSDKEELNHIKLGKSNGQSIICAVKNADAPCDRNSQLFTLKPFGNHQEIEKALNEIIGGQASGKNKIYQNGSVPISDLFNFNPSSKQK